MTRQPLAKAIVLYDSLTRHIRKTGNNEVTNDQLVEMAEFLSGLPRRKTKHSNIGALRWLANRLDVHPSTVARWARGQSNVPSWAIKEMSRIESEHSG